MNSGYSTKLDYEAYDKIEEGISKFSKEGDVILAGDLNAKTNSENDFVSDLQDDHSPINCINGYIYDVPICHKNLDKHPVDEHGKKFLQLCKNSNMRILNGRCRGDRLGNLTRFPTAIRESPSTLDYMATNPIFMKNKIRSMSVLPHIGLSDHNCLCASIVTKLITPLGRSDVNINKTQRVNFVKPSEFLMKLRSQLATEKRYNFFETYKNNKDNAEIDNLYSSFLELFSSFAICKKPPQSRSIKKKCYDKKKPWYTCECRRLKNDLNRAEKNYRKSPFDRGTLQILIAKRKNFKRKCKESEHKLRSTLTKKLLSISEQNPTEFWKLIGKMRNWGASQNDPSNSIDPSDWESHFKSLLNEGANISAEVCEELKALENEPHFSQLDFKVTKVEIDNAFKKLNRKSSPGCDQISGDLLYLGREYFTPMLLLLFNKAFSDAYHPLQWSENFLKPNLKKGETCDPDNSRGIAIGSIVAKLFCLVLLDRLDNRITKTKPISINQIGFMKGYRTADHIFVLKTIVHKIVSNEKKNYL